MLQGQPFGRAVKAARQATFERYPNTNTWGAFQCYGDPVYRLVRQVADSQEQRDIEWVSPGEAAAALNNIAVRLKTMAGGDMAAEQKNLRAMARWLKQKKWLDHGSVCVALGRVFGEAKYFDHAIRYYQKSLRADDGQMTLKDIEQLANFQAREAARRMKDEDPARLLPDIDQAIHLLEMLMGLTPGRSEEPGAAGRLTPAKTGERLALLGGSHKRKAWIDATGRESALIQMARFYRSAFELAQDQGRFDAYPLLNWLTGEVCLAWQKGIAPFADATGPDRMQLLRQAQAELDRSIEQEKNFWTIVMRVDAELLQALSGGDLGAKQINLIAEKYSDAAKLGSPREFASVRDQIDFLIVMAGAQKQVTKDLSALRRKLDQLIWKGTGQGSV
jgi:tetratricopeptide (TPR) repeat protein